MNITISSSNSPGPAFYLLSNPTGENIDLYKMINSSDSLERMTGYYAMLDRGFIDIAFLYDRLRREESHSIKRTIVWIMGFSSNFNSVAEIYTEYYSKAPLVIKKEILAIIKKRDRVLYDKFIKKKKVPQSSGID